MVDQAQSPTQLHVTFRDGTSTELKVFLAPEEGAPVILCLPAMGVSAGYYEVLADTFAENGLTAVLADLRGTGSSSVRASRRVSFGYAQILELELPAIVEAICLNLGVEQVILFGHSLGGQLALLFAATSPRVSGTVAIACGTAWYRRMPGSRSIGRFFGLQLMFGTTLLWGYLPTWFPFAGREARGIMVDWGFEAMTGRYRIARSAVNYETRLAVSHTPALVIAFPDDPLVPPACTDHLASKLNNAIVSRLEIAPELLALKKTHHFRWVFRPRAVVAAVSQWIGQPADQQQLEESDDRATRAT